MSLDKWIKSDKKEETKKESQEKKEKLEKKGAQSEVKKEREKMKLEPKTQKIIKHHLICSKKGCNYQKTIVKKVLTEKDTICPRCKSLMKTK